MKQIRETAAGKSISAWVILKDGKEVATVQAHYSQSRVMVDVWDYGKDIQQGYAGGYGYDKFTAALEGLTIDDQKLYNHCGQCDETKAILANYKTGKITQEQATKKAEKIGARFANWQQSKGKYSDLYMLDGLNRLSAIGYTIIQAI